MSVILLAIALAMDSVALSIASGARLCKMLNAPRAFKLAFTFGAFQGLMPLFGYLLGLGFAKFIAEFDHFIACAILLFLGFKMIKESRDGVSEEGCLIDLPLRFMLMGALATSIDALAVGVTFSFEAINIWLACIIIGLTCVILCVLACYVGKFMGEALEAKALALGGVILIILGIKIPLEHLGYI